jgi:hypothetical protein
MQNLCETLSECPPSDTPEEVDINLRLRMYQETGINRVEIVVDKDANRFTVTCANTRSHIEAGSEQEALKKYVAAKAKTSVVNTGEVLKV